MTLLFSLFLVAHAAIHGLWFTPRPAPAARGPVWPFDVGLSALVRAGVDEPAARRIGLILLTAVATGFVVAALGVLGILPAVAFASGIAIGATSSIAMLLAYFHPWLVLGIGIDVVLLWATLIARWTPAGLQ
jgi:hypothetical protein